MTRQATRSMPLTRFAAIVLVLLSAGASAQPAGPAPEEEIVVTGQRERERKEAIGNFIDSVTVEANGRMAVFHTNVCPASFGLPTGYSEVVIARIRKIAREAGVPLADPDCDPNLVVVIADDGRDFFDALRKDRPALFSALELSEIRNVREAEGPVRAWQLVQLRGADGRPARWVRFQIDRSWTPPVQVLDGVRPSRIQQSTRRDLSIVFVVFDLAATNGLTLTQIADHAAMRALARTEATAAGAPSILALFQEGGYYADALTAWDAAYLKSLYATSSTVSASQQQSNMARVMERELDR